MVGRQDEVDLLLRRWQQAKRGEGRVVLLSGEAVPRGRSEEVVTQAEPVHPAERPVGQAGSLSRSAHIFRNAGRAWQAASQAFTRGAASNSSGALCA